MRKLASAVETVIIPIYKKTHKTDCSSYQGVSWLSTIHKTNVVLSRLFPYVEKINGSHQHKFGSNRSNTDHNIIQLSDTWEKMGILWGSVWDIYRLQEGLWFDYEGVLCNILIEIAIHMKLGRLVNCLNETFKSRQVEIWCTCCSELP